MTLPPSKYAIGFSDSLGGAVVDLGATGSGSDNVSHCFLYEANFVDPMQSRVVQAEIGKGVYECSWSEFLQSPRAPIMLYFPPSGVSLKPALEYARSCIGQKYDLALNIRDGLGLFGRILFHLSGVLGFFHSSLRTMANAATKNCVTLILPGLLKPETGATNTRDLYVAMQPVDLRRWCARNSWIFQLVKPS